MTLTIGTQSILKFDLIQTSPGDDASIAEALPALTREAYLNADYYEVYLTPERGQAIFCRQRNQGDTEYASASTAQLRIHLADRGL